MGTHPIFESDFDCLTENGLKMTRYSAEIESNARSCKTSGSDIRVHFKNTRESAQAIKGMHLHKAVSYLKAVINKERCIPSIDSLARLAVLDRPRSSNRPTLEVDGQRNLVKFFLVCSRTLNRMPK